jgi:hypothetical protein
MQAAIKSGNEIATCNVGKTLIIASRNNRLDPMPTRMPKQHIIADSLSINTTIK